MKLREHRLGLLIALVGAAGVKAFYHSATASELWLFLAPVARLVGWITGQTFVAEPSGYLSPHFRFLIAPACAGVNFFVVTWIALALVRGQPLASVAVAYIATLATNTVRILGAIWLHVHGADDWHHIWGCVAYLGALAVVMAWIGRGRRALWLGLCCYVCVTLLVPLARGAWAHPAFRLHTVVVIGMVTMLIVVVSKVTRASVDSRKTLIFGRRGSRGPHTHLSASCSPTETQ